MMKKINVLQTFVGFNGLTMKDGDSDKDLTFQNVLLTYIAAAHNMRISNDEERALYWAGVAIGASNEAGEFVLLDQPQYDALKKIVDSNKPLLNGKPTPLFNISIHQQAKYLLDTAENEEKEGQ